MKLRQSILALIRSPIKTAVTFVLLAVVSFAFISRGVKFVTTERAIAAAEASYSAVGTVTMSAETFAADPYNELHKCGPVSLPIPREAVDAADASDFVMRSELRKVAGGRSEQFSVVEQPLCDTYYFVGGNWGAVLNTFEMDSAFVIAECTEIGGVYPAFTVESVPLGDEAIARPGQVLYMSTPLNADISPFNLDNTFGKLVVGHRYFMAITTNSRAESNEKEFSDLVDYPLVDLTLLGSDDYETALASPEKYGLPKYSATPVTMHTMDFYRALERIFHTTDVVFTEDMELLPRMHSNEMYITEGRAIAPGDSGMCVVGVNYATKNGLSVGDKITVELSADTMEHSGKVFGREPFVTRPLWLDSQRFSDLGIADSSAELEIVGIWSDVKIDELNPFSYSVNTIFAGAADYPFGEVEPHLLPSTYSFELKHPGDVEKIEAELGETLASMGCSLRIDDGGYAEMSGSLRSMRSSSLIEFAATGAALIFSLVLITYLFIDRRRGDYAIMRALGRSKRKSARGLLSSLLMLAGVAVIIGTLAAAVVSAGTAGEVSAELAIETEVGGTGLLTAAFAIGTLALVWLFARIGLARVGRIPPLELLQKADR